MRVNRADALLILAFTVLIGFAVTLSSVSARNSRNQSQPVAAIAAPAMPNEVHVLQGGFWRTDGGFISTIRIKNVLVVAPIQVSPTLFMADGTAYPLAPVTVPISGVATVDINDALAVAPKTVAPHISQFGNLTLVYQYPTPGHLVATLAAIDAPRSLSFVYMINEPMPMAEDNTLKVVEGLWWKHDSAVHGIISLSNTTEQQRTATLRITREVGDSGERQVELAPHTTQVLALEQFSREGSDDDNRTGGIRVEYKGPNGAIMVAGSLANESEGYSANMPFGPHDVTDSPAKSISLGSAGIMLGKPDPMMMPGFPAETRFIPYLALRNTTAKPLDVTLRLNYTRGMDAAPIERDLPTQRLRPFEAKIVELQAALHASGLKSFDGAINLRTSYTGHSGDLILATGSVDQTGTYVFEVRPQGIGESIGTITGYWSVADGDDSMFSLWNPTDTPQDIIATLYYGDGSGRYHFPVHLAPQASITIDVAMLIRGQQPDADGKVIPSGVREGSASFDTAGRDGNAPDGKKLVTVVISGGLYNVRNGTCGMNCTYCNGYSNFVLNPSSLFCLVGCTAQFIVQATDSYGSTQTLQAGSWSSDNTAVMTVNNSGATQGVGSGQTYINAYLNGVMVQQGSFCVSDSMTPICATSNQSAFAQVSVAPVLSSLSPAQGAIGATTAVTLNGNGFGSTCANVSISAGSGITATCNSANKTQIQASFAVSASASGGNQSVNVKVNGQTSPALNFYVQIPTSLSIVSGTDSTTNEAACTFISNGTTYTGCGVTRSFTYQVNDQHSPPQPIQAVLQFWDSFGTVSPNPLGIGGFMTTCTGTSAGTNNGPCGVTTNSNGQFLEKSLSVCSTVCRSNGVCTTGGPSVVTQTYHVGTGAIAQSISYYCSRVLVNGQ